MNDFSQVDVPLYPGRLVGLRSFKLDGIDGKLTGVSYQAPWVNGENDAKCGVWDAIFAAETKGLAFRPDPTGFVPTDHQVATRWCTCGFYAYFAQQPNSFHQLQQIEGIIEAWGKVTIGLKGFRASKARIVALAIPHESFPTTPIAKLRHRFSCEAPWHSSHAWSYPALAEQAGCTLPSFPWSLQRQENVKRLITRYPDARIFQTIEDAIEAFPPTPLNVAQEICEMGN
jgi:hypothetical protein